MPFSYFGAKHRLAKTYQEPRHATIVEPFAGSAAYAVKWLCERPSMSAILIDKDDELVALWDRFLSMTVDQVAALVQPEQGETTTDPIYAFNSATSPWSSIRNQGFYTITERMAADWRSSGHKRLIWARGHIGDRNRIDLRHGEYHDAPNIEATWFIDPPYQHQGHRYFHGSDQIDFQDLAAWCMNRQGQTIVTEAAPADWLPFEPHMTLMNQENGMNTELVWNSEPDLRLFHITHGDR